MTKFKSLPMLILGLGACILICFFKCTTSFNYSDSSDCFSSKSQKNSLDMVFLFDLDSSFLLFFLKVLTSYLSFDFCWTITFSLFFSGVFTSSSEYEDSYEIGLNLLYDLAFKNIFFSAANFTKFILFDSTSTNIYIFKLTFSFSFNI